MLANRIVILRQRLGMSQAQLARALHISTSAEGMYEQGRRTPNLDVLVQMARTFGVSLDYLITGSEFKYAGIKERRIPDNCPCATCYWKEYIGK